MNVKDLRRYNWCANAVPDAGSRSFAIALNSAFLYLAASDIQVLGKEKYSSFLIPCSQTIEDFLPNNSGALPLASESKFSDRKIQNNDTYLWTELHVCLHYANVTNTLLDYTYKILKENIVTESTLPYLIISCYICAHMLLYESFVLGRIYHIATERLDGKVFALYINAVEAILPTCSNRLYILDPMLTLLTLLLPYIQFSINTNYSAKVINLLRPKLSSNDVFIPESLDSANSGFLCYDLTDSNRQFKPNQILNLCLDILLRALTEPLIVNNSKRTIPIQNVHVRMLLMACQFIISALSIFKGLDQLALINYIESILGYKLFKDYNSRHRGTILFSVLFSLLRVIKCVGDISSEIRFFICEAIFALTMCTYYYHIPSINKAMYNDTIDEHTVVTYFDILQSNNIDGESFFSFSNLGRCIAMVLRSVVLGNVIHRYETGTLFLYNNLLVPESNIGYLWVKGYHSMVEMYSSIITNLYSEASLFCNETLRVHNLTFYRNEEVHLSILSSIANDRISYTENNTLEQYPFIYEVSLPKNKLQAIYIAKTCDCVQVEGDASDNKHEQKLSFNKDSKDSATGKYHVFSLKFTGGEFDTYRIMKSYDYTMPSSTSHSFYISWTHPSTACHFDAIRAISQEIINLYSSRTTEMSPVFNALALGKLSAFNVPDRSYVCYGYATVSDKGSNYIKPTIEEIYNTLQTVYDRPIQITLTPTTTKNQHVFLSFDAPSPGRGIPSSKNVFTVPVLQKNTGPVPVKELFTTKTLRPSQFKALIYAILSPILFILGCPGSGKSTTLAHISKMLLLAENAESKWISTGTKKNKWKDFKTVYTKSVKTYTSYLEMITDMTVGTQLFLIASSNNAVDQLTKYIIMADNWAQYTIPFAVRIGDRSTDPFVRNFMPLHYLCKIITELNIPMKNSEQLETSMRTDPNGAFNTLSSIILFNLREIKGSSNINISPKQYSILEFILSDYMIYNEWLMNHASIVISTVTGMCNRIRFLQKYTDKFPNRPCNVRFQGYDEICTLLNNPNDSFKSFEFFDPTLNNTINRSRNYRHNTGETLERKRATLRKIQYRSPTSTKRYFIIEEAARLAEHDLALILLANFDKLILIGDVLQLPPLILDQKLAATAAMDWSLFHRICYSSCKRIPIVTLEEQARSCSTIADLYRSLYKSRLPEVCRLDSGLRDMPDLHFNSFIDKAILAEFGGRCFFCPPSSLQNDMIQKEQIGTLIKTLVSYAVSKPRQKQQEKEFEDKHNRMSMTSNNCINKQEENVLVFFLLRIVLRLIQESSSAENLSSLEFVDSKNWYNVSCSVALLSLYNAQKQYLQSDPNINYIKELCSHSPFSLPDGNRLKISLELDIETSDGYQGLEADIVFLSLVGTTGNEFRNNICRALVAVSRARRLFVCVGSADKFSNTIWENVAKRDACPDA